MIDYLRFMFLFFAVIGRELERQVREEKGKNDTTLCSTLFSVMFVHITVLEGGNT